MPIVSVLIREAIESDFLWIESLMQDTLESYYGGDHKAHAKRIFEAHINGGTDHIGFFSFEQKIFIAEIDGKQIGVINVAGKRQSTYKISPLIVIPEFQGKCGVGSCLLEHVINYAKENRARQIYCTVAKQNKSALKFFLNKGFIRAGSSDSHYKIGITETMLYKPLYKISEIVSLDQIQVSVILLNEHDKKMVEQVRQMLFKELQNSFKGIDDDWVNALFGGYSRRLTSDVNTKFKLIYVAIDSKGKVIGVAGATPKKGNPIKVMPFIAINQIAFEALLIDIPYQLVSYGHKLYVHINPTVNEVISLQRLGWELNAVMPAGYHPNIVTQQWSLNIGESTMKTMRIKQKFFNLIESGKKTLEVRVGYDNIKRIKSGESIRLMTHTNSFCVDVVDVRKYETFEAMLAVESFKNIVPNSSSKSEVLALLKKIYPTNKEKLGVIVLEFANKK